MKHLFSLLATIVIALSGSLSIHAQTKPEKKNSGPSIVTPTGGVKRPEDPYKTRAYPWHKNITATVFWVGEKPTPRNLTPNKASSWDTQWQRNFGGFDNPAKSQRVGFRPIAFIPRQNPFYIALPYNDVINHKQHKPEASKVIPWFRRAMKPPGKSTCKGRWVQIVFKGKVCYAQWEDCGPWTTTDYEYVFLNKPPKNKENKGAGIDVSPAVRDYLGMKSGDKVSWRFIDFYRIRTRGPWALYGDNNPFRYPRQDPDFHANQRYMKYLKKIRDQASQK